MLKQSEKLHQVSFSRSSGLAMLEKPVPFRTLSYETMGRCSARMGGRLGITIAAGTGSDIDGPMRLVDRVKI